MKQAVITALVFLGLTLGPTGAGVSLAANQPGQYQAPGGYGYPPSANPWQFRPTPPSSATGTPPAASNRLPPQGQQPPQGWNQWQGVPYPQQRQAAPYPQQRPAVPYPQTQGRAAPYGQPQRQQASAPPRLEVELSNTQPYLQETVLLTLRVVSDVNLRTANPVFPQSEELVFQKIKEPKASLRTRNGKQEIVNEFYYVATPLKSGIVTLPRLSVTGTLASQVGNPMMRPGSGESFEVSSRRSLKMKVRPADPSVKPWLPAEQISLRARIQSSERAEAGKPLRLTIDLTAAGTTGASLPSLEDQLQTSGFRVYREKTHTESKLSKDGRRLLGRRLESFTVVPQYSGELQLPALRLAWWNVRTGDIQYASVPIRPLEVGGGLRGEGLSGLTPTSSLFPAGSPSVFWIPLATVFGILAGYWLAVWLRGRAKSEERREEREKGPGAPIADTLHRVKDVSGAALQAGLRRIKPVATATFRALPPGLNRVSTEIRKAIAPLSPGPFLRRLSQRLIFALPASLRFWYCIRAIEDETEPELWVQSLKTLACKHIGLPEHSPLARIGEKIAFSRSDQDQAEIRRLIRVLDAAVYGKEPLDFESWKREFKKLVRPRMPVPKRIKVRPGSRLPDLNPRTV